MVMVVPVYEEEITGVYFNTAAVIDADGSYLGKFRKVHIPHTWPGFWEKFYFKPGNLGFPVFETAYAKIGIYICYDRHFPECARVLALKGAEILFNPSATVAGKSQYLWQLEQPAQAVANGVFIGANNRVGVEKPWDMGMFYGSQLLRRPPRAAPGQGQRGPGRGGRRRSRPRADPRGARRLAVLPRPQARRCTARSAARRSSSRPDHSKSFFCGSGVPP